MININAVLKELSDKDKNGFSFVFTGSYVSFLETVKEISTKYTKGNVCYKQLGESLTKGNVVNVFIIKDATSVESDIGTFLKNINDTDDSKILVFAGEVVFEKYPEILRENRFDKQFFIKNIPFMVIDYGNGFSFDSAPQMTSLKNQLSKHLEILRMERWFKTG